MDSKETQLGSYSNYQKAIEAIGLYQHNISSIGTALNSISYIARGLETINTSSIFYLLLI